MTRLWRIVLLVLVAGIHPAAGEAQTAGLGLRPMRLEMDVTPGRDKTMSFVIESAPSDPPVRGRLLLTLGDWTIAEDTTVSYHDPGSHPDSASPWLVLSSADVPIESGQERLVRVTARVPAGVAPGVYTSAIFVQERPPASPPQLGEHHLYFRFRYVVTVYVIVSPVAPRGEVEDVRLVSSPAGVQQLATRLTNTGTRHARPTMDWSVRRAGLDVAVWKNIAATVLLPASSITETIPLTDALTPGEYEIEVQVDFHDGGPIHAVRRPVVIDAVAFTQ